MSNEETNRQTRPLEDPAAAIKDRRYAGFWMRFWAFLVDLIVVYSINGILLSPLKFMNDAGTIDIGFWTLSGILGAVVFYIYFLLMTKFSGQTIGKMIFGLRVIRENGAPLRWSDLFFREVIGRFLYRALFIMTFMYVVVAFTTQKQGVHDIFASTRVVHVD